MKPTERKRRAKLRRQARARRARKLFREFVANKKREWDAQVQSARDMMHQAQAGERRVQRMFDSLVEIILAVNPDFPIPGRYPREAPPWVKASGMEKTVPARKWGALMSPSHHPHHMISERELSVWFSFIRYELDNDRMRRSRLYRITVTNHESRQQAAIEYALSNELLCSEVPIDMVLMDSARRASRGLIEHMRKE